MDKKKVLVVGGAGFIGSHVNKMLNQAGYETVVYDNLSQGNRQAVTRGLFIEGDIGDESELDVLFKQHQFDGVMHFAALIDVGESVRAPAKYYINNVVNTIKLLEAMRQHQVNFFVFSSSAAVYGIPAKEHILELDPCLPINPYGQTKLMAEKILQDYAHAYGLKFISLRYFNAAGGDPEGEIKNYKKKEHNLIPIILHALMDKDYTATIYGTDYPTFDGTCVRDYIHVCDLGSAHIKALKNLWDGAPSNVFNLGNGQGYSVKQVIAAVEKVTSIPIRVIEGQRRAGDPPFLLANSDKARNKLQWTPAYPGLETIISDAWNALQKS